MYQLPRHFIVVGMDETLNIAQQVRMKGLICTTAITCIRQVSWDTGVSDKDYVV